MKTFTTLLLLLITGCSFLGYLYGRRMEKAVWERAIPSKLDALCVECQEIGREEGFNGGRRAGLKTCDDVLTQIDDGGRR